jgi:hypothetical protein
LLVVIAAVQADLDSLTSLITSMALQTRGAGADNAAQTVITDVPGVAGDLQVSQIPGWRCIA